MPPPLTPPWDPDDPRLRRKAIPGETWHDRVIREAKERGPQPDWAEKLQRPREEQPWPTLGDQGAIPNEPRESRAVRPLEPWRKKVMRAVKKGAGPAPHAVKPGQRAPGRRVPPAPQPVDSYRVLQVLLRQWRGDGGRSNRWRIRALAAIAVAMSLFRTSGVAMCAMRPRDVLALRMPVKAWKWVVRWLELRRALLGPESDETGWLSYYRSNGRPRQICWAVSRTLHLSGALGWRLSQLLRASWDHVQLVPFSAVARNLVKHDSPLWPITVGRPFWHAG